MSALGYRTYRIVALLIAMGVVLASHAWAGKFQLPAGQELKVRFDPGQALSSGKLKKGDKITFSLVEPITIAGKTIVEEGAKGSAKVEDATAAKPFKGGHLKVSFESLQPKGEFKAAKDAAIKLEGSVEKQGGNRKLFSIFPGFGFLIKGGQGSLKSDETFTTKVKEAIILESK